MSDRPCTCHPDDNPPVPCPQKFALSECKAAPEPVAWMVYTKDGKSVFVTDNPTDIPAECAALPLFTSPPAAPAPDDARDAARYQFAKSMEGQVLVIDVFRNHGADALDAAIDAAIKEST